MFAGVPPEPRLPLLCGGCTEGGTGLTAASSQPSGPGDRDLQSLLGKAGVKSSGILLMRHFIVSSVKSWQPSFQSKNLDVLLGINIWRLLKPWKKLNISQVFSC